MRKTINPGTSFRGAGSVGSMRGRLMGATPAAPSAWANVRQQAPVAGAVVTPAVPVAAPAPAPVVAPVRPDWRNGRTDEEIASSWGP